jgi:phage head maturation protease
MEFDRLTSRALEINPDLRLYLTAGGGITTPGEFGITAPVTLDTTTARIIRAADRDVPLSDRIVITALAVPYERVSADDQNEMPILFKRGCFGKFLSRRPAPDIRVYFGLGFGNILGRTTSGTAVVFDDSDGLRFEVLPPQTTWADDLIFSIDRGDITGAACLATPVSSHLEVRSGHRVRVIEEATVTLCSVCAFGMVDKVTAKMRSRPGANTNTFTELDRDFLRQMHIQGAAHTHAIV